MGTSIGTKIRLASYFDIPHIVALGELEYNEVVQDNNFSPILCERYLHTMMIDPDSVVIVITSITGGAPFGYIIGTLDNINLSKNTTAITHHWFVHDPNCAFGNKQHGIELMNAFEKWGKSHGAGSVMIGMTQKPNTLKLHSKAFAKMGYNTNVVYYTKRFN
jgi:hypothetical protein|tara:strand:+ start:277 stop:762 length:486 start_codon:yes stop_codon:yes gene_type:complete